MSQLKEREGDPGQNSTDNIVSLLERSLNDGFQHENSCSFSTENVTKRPLKRKRKPAYRKINRYFKSIRQYKKERERRKKILHLWLVEFRSQKYIADKLGVSVSTVKRDQRKLRRFVKQQTNRAIQLLKQERLDAREKRYEGLSLREKFDVLTEEMLELRKFWKRRGYRGHYHIFYLDLTDTDKYGIPKMTQLPRQTAGKTLAYPHKIRVMVKGEYEGRTFEADIGGFNIVQTRGW